MSTNAEQFERLLLSDEALQAKLRAAADAFEGDRKNEDEVFDAVIAPLAAEVGLPFSREEGRAFVASGAELSDEALEAVAGGGCFIFGFQEDIDACLDESLGMTACSNIGVGILTTGD